jgi:hypothetical protein
MDAKFITKQISTRAYVRELKSKLTGLKDDNLYKKANYKAVSEAFSALVIDKGLPEVEFITESGFSQWWNAKKFPQFGRAEIDVLFPELSEKWLDRASYSNRMQMHLTSLDSLYCISGYHHRLFSKVMSSGCGEKEIPSPSEAFERIHEIFNSLHEDWRPRIHNGCFDIYLSGPKKEQATFQSQLSAFEYLKRINSSEGKVEFDFSRNEQHFIGLNLPIEIARIYQSHNPFSLPIFLFVLLCLNFETENEYRSDLVIDFLTSLACVSVLAKNEIDDFAFVRDHTLDPPVHQLYTGILDLLFPNVTSELYQSSRKKQKSIFRTGMATDKVLSWTSVSSSSRYRLIRLFENILSQALNNEDYAALKVFMSSQIAQVRNSPADLDYHLTSDETYVLESIESAHARYFEAFKFVGYSEKKLKVFFSHIWGRISIDEWDKFGTLIP